MALKRTIKPASAVLAASTVVGALALGMAGTASASGQARRVTPQQADRTAIAYVKAHYKGSCRARIQQTEADVEHGVRVYDVQTLAPNCKAYVVHISRSNGHVLWVNPADS